MTTPEVVAAGWDPYGPFAREARWAETLYRAAEDSRRALQRLADSFDAALRPAYDNVARFLAEFYTRPVGAWHYKQWRRELKRQGVPRGEWAAVLKKRADEERVRRWKRGVA